MTSRTAILFPGQGSQEPEMGREAAEANPEIMSLWKKAERISKCDLRGIFWDNDEQAMANTRFLQPALTVVNLGLWLALPASSRPEYIAGHSLGEFSALAAAGVLDLNDTLEAVSQRGRLMAEADPQNRGAMAAVLKLPQNIVQQLVEESRDATEMELCLANLNSPVQFVASGEAPAIEYLEKRVKEAKGKAVRLAVSGAFHSSLMNEAAAEMTRVMRNLDWNRPKIPVLFNVTADVEDDPAAIQEIMARQMISQVRWTEIMHKLWILGVRRYLELGPKGVLSRLAKANLDNLGGEYETLNIDTTAKMQDLA